MNLSLTSILDEYETFFELWNDADADAPILKQARIDYGRLLR